MTVPAVVENPQPTSAVNNNNIVEKDTNNSVYVDTPISASTSALKSECVDGPMEIKSGGKNNDENRISTPPNDSPPVLGDLISSSLNQVDLPLGSTPLVDQDLSTKSAGDVVLANKLRAKVKYDAVSPSTLGKEVLHCLKGLTSITNETIPFFQ